MMTTMTTPTCYKILDLPDIPDEYVNLALDRAKNHQGKMQGGLPKDFYSYSREVQIAGEKVICRNNPRFELEDIMSNWITANISTEWSMIGVATSVLNRTIDYKSTLQSPHTDSVRGYALLYLIESSNFDQDTVFWQESGYPVRRKRGINHFNMDTLTKIDSVRIPPKTWTFIDTSILHGTVNIQNSRITIQISFDIDPFGVFVK
jgi:hypothetical protein